MANENLNNENLQDIKKIDPELAELLEDDVLYNGEDEEKQVEEADEEVLEEHQIKLKKLLEDCSKYINEVLKNEDSELSYKVLESMDLWKNPKYKDEKFKYRERLSQNFWALYRDMAPKIMSNSFSKQKINMIRYGLLDSEYLTKNQQKIVREIEESNKKFKSDSIFLADEWFKNIAKGKIPSSVMDETAIKRKAPTKDKIENKQGQLDAETKSAKNKIEIILDLEDTLKECIDKISQHEKHPDFNDNELITNYESMQRETITQLLDIGRKLLNYDRQLGNNYKIIDKIKFDIQRLEKALEDGEDFVAGNELIIGEFLSFRQMVKMSAGRQGNHFPILYSSYFSEDAFNIATKQNVAKIIDDVEKLDPSVFVRTYKSEDNRIYPYIVIVPSYGHRGICWEPFSRTNRATSKARLVIPMYPKNLKVTVLTALADLRWQVAKEKAQHYWMEEGLTGYYYEYFTKEKLKGNIKNHFIADYILWLAWESKGIQRLHKDVRPIFWRYTPFPQKIKDSLKNRGFYYQQLYKKDQNREKSTGY